MGTEFQSKTFWAIYERALYLWVNLNWWWVTSEFPILVQRKHICQCWAWSQAQSSSCLILSDFLAHPSKCCRTTLGTWECWSTGLVAPLSLDSEGTAAIEVTYYCYR